MQGLMQQHQLLISSIIAHAARHHGDGEIVSRRADGSLAHTTYRAIEERSRRLVEVLQALGVKPGDRVGTLAMNSDRHMELYYGISGMGAVCHTVNPRLFVELFAVPSWEEHLRQHRERQTGTDLEYHDDAAALSDPPPRTDHYLAAAVPE